MPDRLQFDRFEMRLDERRLFVDGSPAALGSRAFDMLEALVERRDRLVAKSELLDVVWPGLVVEDNNLHVHVSALRKVLGSQAIATVPGRGYRFTLKPAGEASVTIAAPSPAPKLRSNLPEVLPQLIGRDDELALLGDLLEQHRFVSVVGAGGIGKSRLVQALLHARREAHAHGVCWVSLPQGGDAASLPAAIAVALDVKLGPDDPLAGLVAAIAPLSQVLALDGAEAMLDAVAPLAQALHEGAPGLRLVVTSQAPLKVPGEHVWRLGAMAWPDGSASLDEAARAPAIALFVQRAKAADLRFALQAADVPALVALCRSLDGLPLAIELAAARVAMLGVAGLLASLDKRLKLLTTGADRQAPARQRTLRATLEWSHALLGPEEQTVFRRFAVVAGSASLDLAKQLATDATLDEWGVLDALASLVERSLVSVEAGDAGAPRYRLLDSPRAFALERLAASGEAEEVRERHASALAARCIAVVDDHWHGRVGVDAWRRAFEADLPDAREALAWARARGELDTALAIATALIHRLPLAARDERLTLSNDIEPWLGETSLPAARRLQGWVAVCAALRTNWPQRLHDAASQVLALAAGDPAAAYVAHSKLAIAATLLGDADAATAALAAMRAVEDPAWPPHRLIFGADAEYFATRSGDATAALRLARRQLALARAAGGSGSIAMSNLIDAELQAGDAGAAVRTGSALVAQLEGSRDESDLAFGRLNLAAAWLALGDTAQARPVMSAGWPQAARFGLQRYWADFLALLAALENRPEAATRLLGFADAAYGDRAAQRQPNEAAAYARAATLAYAALGEDDFERLRAEGRVLREGEIEDLAFSSRGRPGEGADFTP